MLERAADAMQVHMPMLIGLQSCARRASPPKRHCRGARGDRLPALLRRSGARAGRCRAARSGGLHQPWNFPLAIFTGQVAAALVAGNPVLAKPAEETPLIAAEAVRLLHEAGVPEDALQLVPGAGDVGAALVGAEETRA
jgi:RHH-type proline utilization regulon transcriptional repressor/proline dehydrogenase/delta 1-pyrroline-5-carboxylate dehydrogenase